MASDLVERQTSCPGAVVMPPACLPVMQFAIVSQQSMLSLLAGWSLAWKTFQSGQG